MRIHALLLRVVPAIALLGVALLVAACRDDSADEVGDDRLVVPDSSPTSLGELPEDIEEASIAISDADLVEDEVELVEERPTVLRVTNNDDAAYRLQIDPIVNGVDIPAGGTTEVEFTTPVQGEYTGELMSGDEVIDTIIVAVISAAGVPD